MSKDISDWVENRFQGLTKDQLREAGSILGSTFGPNTSEKTMREQLCAKVGQAPLNEPEVVIPIKSDRKPNLTPNGKWEGRKYRVILKRNAEEAKHKSRILHFECVPKAFPFDEVIDLPEPYYGSMKNATRQHASQKPVKDDEGNLLKMELTLTPYDGLPFQYLGITPGTEDLPGSYQEYWREQAKKTDYFAQYDRVRLMAINSDFVGSLGAKAYRDVTTEEIRANVLRACGLEDAMLGIAA